MGLFFDQQKQKFELTTNTIQIFHGGQIGQQCLQSLMLHKQSFTFN